MARFPKLTSVVVESGSDSDEEEKEEESYETGPDSEEEDREENSDEEPTDGVPLFASVTGVEDDVDEVPTPEDGPTTAVPYYKMVFEEDGFPSFLKKTRLGCTFEIGPTTVVPSYKTVHEDDGFPSFLKKTGLLGTVEEEKLGPTTVVPSYKRVHEVDGFPSFLKKARLGGTFKIGSEPTEQNELPFFRSPVPLEDDELPLGSSDWTMAYNVSMGYVKCPLCLGYVVCEGCGNLG